MNEKGYGQCSHGNYIGFYIFTLICCDIPARNNIQICYRIQNPTVFYIFRHNTHNTPIPEIRNYYKFQYYIKYIRAM